MEIFRFPLDESAKFKECVHDHQLRTNSTVLGENRLKYELGQIYRDKGSTTDTDDQFLRWINLPGSGMQNSPGIRPLRFTSQLSSQGLPAYLVLVTHEATGGQLNPWDDVIDLSSAQILYWGDAKFHESRRIDDFNGNRKLRAIFDYLTSGRLEMAPPILHFSKPEKGRVKFNGLCCMDKLEISWFDDHGNPVQNYHAILTILDCAEVEIDWLHQRVTCSDPAELDRHEKCPKAWTNYKRGRTKALDIWSPQIRSEAHQRPETGSEDEAVLNQLVDLDPFDFEKVIVALFQEIPEITHHIAGTKNTADGGFDFFGTFKLPRPVNYEIKFRGEVKRYARSTAVDPKSVSRLVARLSRMEYGIFVTTSYFTKQAQREVLQDAYPVHLIAGIDLVMMLKHLRLVSRGKIRQDWLSVVIGVETDQI
ncbi:restriction endonuclease [Pseudomonadota bacterium]